MAVLLVLLVLTELLRYMSNTERLSAGGPIASAGGGSGSPIMRHRMRLLSEHGGLIARTSSGSIRARRSPSMTHSTPRPSAEQYQFVLRDWTRIRIKTGF